MANTIEIYEMSNSQITGAEIIPDRLPTAIKDLDHRTKGTKKTDPRVLTASEDLGN